MANIKSAQKDILKSGKRRERNLLFKTRMKTYIKKSLQAIEQKIENRKEIVQETLRIIDKTAGKGVIKRESASRKKSRLVLRLNKSLV